MCLYNPRTDTRVHLHVMIAFEISMLQLSSERDVYIVEIHIMAVERLRQFYTFVTVGVQRGDSGETATCFLGQGISFIGTRYIQPWLDHNRFCFYHTKFLLQSSRHLLHHVPPFAK